MNKKIVEKRICKWTGEEFVIFQGDIDMLEKLSPKIGGEKIDLPIPDLSPRAREINRLMFRNERKFYKVETENGLKISTIHPDMRKRIFSIEDFGEYNYLKDGVEYSGGFFNDFYKLLKSCPHVDIMSVGNDDSSFCNQEAYDKKCYLNCGGHGNEDSMYNTFATESKDVVDNYWVFKGEIVYESLNVFSSSKVFFSQQIKNSYDIYFGYDLLGCQKVIFGNDLKNQKYVYKNEVLKKEDWEEKYREFKSKLKTKKGLEELKNEFREFLIQTKAREVFIEGSENSYGNIITDSKNSFGVLYGENNENLRYGNICWDLDDGMDISSFANGKKLFNIGSSFNVTNSICSSLILETNYCYYSLGIDGSSNMFGCFGFGLKHKSYCILNKEYEKEKWEEKVKEIIKELKSKNKWGRFIDTNLSPYPYNDSVASEYYPIKKVIFLNGDKIEKEENLNQNGIGVVYILEPNKFISKAIIDFGGEEKVHTFWRTKDVEINIPQNAQIIKASNLPEIDDVDVDLLTKSVIICKKSGRPFRIVAKELEFYKKYGLPLPELHYDERHLERINKKTTKFFHKD